MACFVSLPHLKLVQDIIGYFLIFHLVGVTCLFNENQLVFFCGRHVIVQVAEKLGRISVREIVVGSDKESAGVADFFSLR